MLFSLRFWKWKPLNMTSSAFTYLWWLCLKNWKKNCHILKFPYSLTPFTVQGNTSFSMIYKMAVSAVDKLIKGYYHFLTQSLFFFSSLAGITFQCKQAIFIRIWQLFHNRAAHGRLLCVKFPNQLQKQPAFWHLPAAKLSHHLPSCLCERNLCHCERGAVSSKSGKK